MTHSLRISTLALVVALSAGGLAMADQPRARLVRPGVPSLPSFGFDSFNIRGYGEQVTYVRWGGIASQLGLEPGDVIVRLNGVRLAYHGAWHDALGSAMDDGGYVTLAIRDVNTGRIVNRSTYLGGGVVGPITPKAHQVHRHPHHHGHVRHPAPVVGPITPKANHPLPQKHVHQHGGKVEPSPKNASPWVGLAIQLLRARD